MASTDQCDLRLNSTAVARCSFASIVSALAVAASGAIGLMGWVLGNHLLQSVFSGDIIIKANTAVGLLLAGLAVLLEHQEKKTSPVLERVSFYCALLLAMLGAATLLEHLTGWDLKIDQILFTEAPGAAATSSPGRMGPPAATSFALAGISLLILRLRSSRAIYFSQAIALVLGVVALIPLIGYAYRITPLYGLSQYTGIAFQTALSLFLLSFAILNIRPREGLMTVVNAADAGGIMCRRLILPVIFIPFALGLLRTLAASHRFVDEAFGRPTLIMALIISFIAIVWWNARAMSKLSREHTRAEEGRRVNAERLRLAIEAGRFAPWEFHGDTDEMWCSPEYQNLLGLKPGKSTRPRAECVACLHSEDRERIDKRLRGAIADRKPYEVEYRVVHSDGTLHWVASRGDVVWDDHGNVLGLVGIAHDITARKKSEEALTAAKISAIKAKEIAEAANTAKDRFLASLSHELRTPLTPVLATTQIIENMPDLPEHLREQIVMIRRNVQLETRLIDDLLDLTRVSRGKLRLELAQIDLHQQVQHVADICRGDFESREILFRSDLRAEKTIVSADGPRLQQILWNLLKNAVKFTHRGGLVVVETRNNSANSIEIRVMDNGIGIEPENLIRIFNAFEQGNHDITRQFGGLGLGLAISKAVADLHGGTLIAESRGLGHGATFMLTLPLAAEQQTTDVRPADSISADLRNLRLLLVEDHPDTARAMIALLKINGCHVVSASNVTHARELLDQHDFDLILSDLGLPDGTGYDLIRYAARNKRVRAIALSGFGMEEDQRRSREAGFFTHLTKPVDHDALVRAIHSAMQVV